MPKVCLVGSQSPVEQLLSIEAKLDCVIAQLDGLDRAVARAQLVCERWYTRSETAAILRVSTKTIDRMVAAGKLRAVKRNGRVRINGSSILNCGQPQGRLSLEVLHL